MPYIHITERESIAIDFYLSEWKNKSEIARLLWRSHTTIGREIENYSHPESGEYEAEYAIYLRSYIQSQKQRKTRIVPWTKLEVYILKKIQSYWSPEQIAGRWKKETWEKISKDTIYTYIYEHYPELIKAYFRRKGKKYQHQRKEKYQLNDRRMIDLRPKYIEKRKTLGHWEADTIIGKNRKWAIFTNVERKSGYLLTKKLNAKSGREIEDAFRDTFETIPRNMRKTTTVDNGREFSEHKMVEYFTWTLIYFAHTYASWERGTNENTNGLLRQFIPKKTDFKTVSEGNLEKYTKLINLRPRKRLNYKTPYEVFFKKKLTLCTLI
jgi:transposase, IS30 family